ncbi:MAG: 30S ribosomal protein S3 [Candidatus Nanohaloarchaea archaeon]
MQEKQFIEKGARRVRLDEYFEEELEGAGYSHSDIVRTPTSTKIVVHAERPGLVIGRGGSHIQEITEDLEDQFDFENPQVDVNEIEEGDRNAEVVAKAMASWLEKGGSAKRVGYTYLRRIKEAGVIGAEMEITGKLSGNRGRTEKFSYGYVKRCGNTSEDNVEKAYTLARTKPGAVGIKVRIMKELPEFKHRDVDVQDEILHETIEDEGPPKSERMQEIIAEADNMTAAAIEEAAENAEVSMDDIEIGEVRDAFEDMDEEDVDDIGSEEEPSDSTEDEEKAADEEETSEDETESGDTEEADYDEIVSGTISDAKDELEGMESPDYTAALEAEKDNKNRTTFIDWLEARTE